MGKTLLRRERRQEITKRWMKQSRQGDRDRKRQRMRKKII